MTYVPRRRKVVKRKPINVITQREEPIKRGYSTPVTHTTIHHGADILELTVKTLRYGEGFICTKKTFNSISGRMNGFFREQRPKQFKSKEWSGLQHINRVA
jgi:hypothetical protein